MKYPKNCGYEFENYDRVTYIFKREKKQITTIALEYHLEKISINPSEMNR